MSIRIWLSDAWSNLSMYFLKRVNAFSLQVQRKTLGFHVDIAVYGNYYTGNLGDKAIGYAFRERLKKLDKKIKYLNFTNAPANSKIVVLGGGGVLHDHNQGSLDARLSYLEQNKRIFMIGVGSQNFIKPENKKRMSRVLDAAEYVSVRDPESGAVLNQLTKREILVTGCPVFSLETNSIRRHQMSAYTLVNLMPWFKFGKYRDTNILHSHFGYESNLDLEEASELYLQNIRQICSSLENPIFVALAAEDYRFAKRFLSIKRMPFTSSVPKLLSHFKSAERIVAMRHHATLFSVLFEKPSFSLAYSPKCEALCNRFELSCSRPHREVGLIEYRSPNRSTLAEVRTLASQDFDFLIKSVQ